MNTHTVSSLSSPRLTMGAPDGLPLHRAVLAYVSAVSASVAAVAALVGAGIPLEVLVGLA
jgi:hypothetical protein